MLILERKPTEQILLKLPGGETIEITNVRMGRGACRIGVSAPHSVRIVRSELITESDSTVCDSKQPAMSE